ncbi:MAG TPA: DUF1302 family protein [Kofleriaceae bacterium]
MTARVLAIAVCAIGLVIAAPARADDAKIAVFDFRPVRSNGQTDLSRLRESVKLSADLRDRLAAAAPVHVVAPDEVKRVLGGLYRVAAFDCRESPPCLQPMMRKLAAAGIARAVIGTYELAGDRVQLTLHGIDTKTGAFTKVALLDAPRGGALDDDAAANALREVAGVIEAATEPAGSGSGDQTDELVAMPPPPPPPLPDRIQVLGWARVQTALGLAKQSTDPLDPPYDRVVSHDQIFLAARYQRSNRYAATASGLLEWNVFDTRTAFSASLRELYVGAFWDHLDVRVGNQRIPWGKGDAISPNDILNPRDLRDPLLCDPELRRIPTFAIRVDASAGSSSLQLVVEPFFVPDRYDVYGSNWAVIQPSSPVAYRGFFGLLNGLFDPTLHDDVQQLFAQTSLPTLPSAGAHYTYTGHELDASVYYQYGYSSTPRVTVNPAFASALSQVDWTTATPSTLAPVLDLLDAGVKPFTATFVRRNHVGVDGVTTVGPFALKLDAAYETRGVFYQPDFTSFTSPFVQGVASVEYQSGELGKVVLLEAIYQHIFDPLPSIGLLGYEADTAALSLLARWTFFDRIEVELRALEGVDPRTTIVQPQLAYHTHSGSWTFAVGGLAMRGQAFSLGDYYSRNEYVYGLVKYAL